MPKISIVMPAYNVAGVIEEIVGSYTREILNKLPGSEFIIAEDGSTDGTKEKLTELSKKYKIKLVQSNERKGYLRAVKDAFKLPKNEIIFFSDSDGEHDPRDFWNLYNKMNSADVVIGYKVKRKPFYRLLISKFNNMLIGMLFGVWLNDANCGFRLIRRKIVHDVMGDVGTLKWACNAEFAIRASKKGYRVAQAPVRHSPRPSNVFPVSKLPKVIFREITDIIRLRAELR